VAHKAALAARRSRVKRLVVVAFALLAAACTTKYLPGTQIPDTEENRKLLSVIEDYRRAVEDKDIGRIMSLVSDRFYQDPGTPGDPTDDYDKAGLKKRLEQDFARIGDQKLDVTVRKLFEDPDKKTARVQYAFNYRYKLAMPGSQDWQTDVDLAQVTLDLENGQWKILSGI
jgi:hypothetical protein